MHMGDPAPLGPRNAQVQRLRSLLHDRTVRRSERVFVAEGVRLIEGLLDRRAPVQALYVEVDPHDPARVDELRSRVGGSIDIRFLEQGLAKRISATVTPQSVFAEVGMDTADLTDVAAGGAPALVVVDIQDPGNAGTMLRSAEAAGCAAVVFAGDSVDPWNPKVVRASAGAVSGVAIVEENDPVKVLAALGDAGFSRVAAVARDGVAPDALGLGASVAIVVGSEAHGLPVEVVEACDALATIPMHGAVESLNAGMAATVIMFEAARQRGWDA